VLSGLSSDPDRTKAGFHDRALASFMTGVELTKGKVQVGISVDQLAAQALGKETQFRVARARDRKKQPVAAPTSGPVFKKRNDAASVRSTTRASSSNGSSEREAALTLSLPPAREAADRSSLDAVTERIAELKRQLGPSDRRKAGRVCRVHSGRGAPDSGGHAEKAHRSARDEPARRGPGIPGPST